MPRKQRFKPSRKPKPIVQSEEAVIGRQGNGATPLNDNAEATTVPRTLDGASAIESGSGSHSR